MQRYGVIYSDIWTDEEFKSLSMQAKAVYLYLLSSPHSNLSGFYKLPDVYAAYDIGITDGEYRTALSELEEKDFVYTNKDVVLIKSYLKHNKVQNDKQAKGAWNFVDRLPFSELTVEFAHNCIVYAPNIVQFFSKEMIRYLFDNHTTKKGVDISLKLSALREDYMLLTQHKQTH